MSKQEQEKNVNQVISDAACAKPSENLSEEELDKVAGGMKSFPMDSLTSFTALRSPTKPTIR